MKSRYQGLSGAFDDEIKAYKKACNEEQKAYTDLEESIFNFINLSEIKGMITFNSSSVFWYSKNDEEEEPDFEISLYDYFLIATEIKGNIPLNLLVSYYNIVKDQDPENYFEKEHPYSVQKFIDSKIFKECTQKIN